MVGLKLYLMLAENRQKKVTEIGCGPWDSLNRSYEKGVKNIFIRY